MLDRLSKRDKEELIDKISKSRERKLFQIYQMKHQSSTTYNLIINRDHITNSSIMMSFNFVFKLLSISYFLIKYYF